MSIRTTYIAKENIYVVGSSFTVQTKDMYLDLFINGEEISVHDMINHMFPFWRVKGKEALIEKRYNAFRDPLLELRYVNYVCGHEVQKVKEMKDIYKHLLSLYQLSTNSNGNSRPR